MLEVTIQSEFASKQKHFFKDSVSRTISIATNMLTVSPNRPAGENAFANKGQSPLFITPPSGFLG
jgi:hypothetical protein